MAPKTSRARSHTVRRPRLEDGASALVAQGRLVDAVADGAVLCGSTDDLAGWLDVSAGAFRGALTELVAVRWIVAQARPDGRLTVRWERRQYQVPVAVERRRSAD